ncbi:molybdenum ABC transporter ATP-binding protein [Brachybacterium endophyticum]|uniref:Molybdenum ABC transporter ATP-binding protein n=1 Tax=Brachybacterium endophyticum TaxID=2182385 RepID=A0A2U2RHX8_9MICO|nr:ABC transporter ATP-binding protein [Brachybacterium endophyticum]PWH05482.1 molybdenum ABC transporter ATP-binding protein [Brachybacterium endophyticum]
MSTGARGTGATDEGPRSGGTTHRGSGLSAQIEVERTAFTVRADLTLAPGQRLALLGANGAGKSTILGALAGTVPLSAGRISLGEAATERVLDAPGRRSVPAHRRAITLLEQRPLLFPHLDLVGNVAFGPRSRGSGRRASRDLALEWLERVDLTDHARQRPYRLSGGQQQRVALARAFAAGPSVILLDEPFAALDAETVPRVRGMLDRELTRTGTTAVLVTHQLSDAWDLADTCLVLEAGRVREQASPEHLVTAPRSRFGARLAGFGAIEGETSAQGLRVEGVLLPGRPDPGSPPRRGVRALGIASPTDVELLPGTADASLASVPGRVIGVRASAGRVLVEADNGLIADVTTQRATEVAGQGLPVVGSRLGFAPRSLRLVGLDVP